jgi:tetratricopeptide (TPR) repeat protein
MSRRKASTKSRERSAPPVANAKRFREWIVLALILLATIVVYWPARNGEQLWDDDGHITKPELQSLHGLARIWFEPGASQQYYPLLHTAFWIEHKLWGDNTLGYHVINVLLHMAAVTLFYLILRRLKIPGALLAAAIFALHPVMVESVAWISEQKNTLSAVFYLGAMLVYLHFDQSRNRSQYFVALGLFVLGLLTKTVTATLPAALLVIFWWQRGTLSWKRDVLPLVPFFMIGAAGGAVTAYIERTLIGAEGADFSLTLVERGLLAGRVVWFYLGKLLWPMNLTFIYPRWEIDPQVWWQWLFPTAAIGVTIGLLLNRPSTASAGSVQASSGPDGKRWRGPLAGWLLFIGTLFPVLGFLNVYPFLFSYVADHFQYLASLGMIALVAAGIAIGLRRLPQPARGVGLGSTVLLVLALATLSFRQSRMYADRVTLYESTVARNPDSWLAHNNLGAEYERAGDHEAAMKQFRTAISLRPNCAEAHSSLGSSLAVVGRLPEALEEHQKALELKPSHPLFLAQQSLALISAGRQAEAVEKLQVALTRAPDDPIIHSTLGVALTQLGRYPEAKEHLERAIELLPEYAEAHQNLGTVLAYTGQTQQAIDEIRRSLEVNPNSMNAHSNLAFLLGGVGDTTGAITHYEAALRVRPGNADIQNKLAVMLQQAGRPSEAIPHFQAAISLQPNLLPAYGSLARTLAAVNRRAEAIATAEKAIEVARTTGLDSEAAHIAEWLAQYRAELHRAGGVGSSSQPSLPQNNRGKL